MKRITLSLAAFLTASVAMAQMYVSANSYAYVTDEILFVTQDVDLSNNGHIYLRDQGQLMQGTTGAGNNKGDGDLSVYQEGTSDQFQYNHWCSPIGTSTAGNTVNEPFGISLLNRPDLTDPTNTTSTAATILSQGTWDGQANNAGNLEIARRWIYKYISSSSYSNWIGVFETSTINAGEGFSMKGTSGTDGTNNTGNAQRYDFRGKPNDGTITISVANGQFSLTGNPYPSAMDTRLFLLHNSGNDITACVPSAGAATNTITGTAYYWEHQSTGTHALDAYTGGYGTYVPVDCSSAGSYTAPTFQSWDNTGDTVDNPNTGTGTNVGNGRIYSPIGQGFMIEGSAAGVATHRNIYRAFQREGASSVMQRTASVSSEARVERDKAMYSVPVTDAIYELNPVSQLRLETTINDSYFRHMNLIFHHNATDNVDNGMDGRLPISIESTGDAHFPIADDRYSIQAVQFDIDKMVPFGFVTEERATFSVRVANIEAFDNNQDVFMYDSTLDTYTDIKDGHFDITLDAGEYNNRFYVVFKDDSREIDEINDEIEAVTESLDVFQNNTTNSLIIKNPNTYTVKSFTMHDAAGRLIYNKADLGNNDQYTFPTSSLSSGVYIVKVTTDQNIEIGKKVSVHSRK